MATLGFDATVKKPAVRGRGYTPGAYAPAPGVANPVTGPNWRTAGRTMAPAPAVANPVAGPNWRTAGRTMAPAPGPTGFNPSPPVIDNDVNNAVAQNYRDQLNGVLRQVPVQNLGQVPLQNYVNQQQRLLGQVPVQTARRRR